MLSLLILQRDVEMMSEVPAGRLVSVASSYTLLQLILGEPIYQEKIESIFKYKVSF